MRYFILIIYNVESLLLAVLTSVSASSIPETGSQPIPKKQNNDTIFQLRLVSCRYGTHCEESSDGDVQNVGSLQLYKRRHHDWENICADHSWGLMEAQVACRTLGFLNGAVKFKIWNQHKVSLEVLNSTSAWYNVTCSGSETSLEECSRKRVKLNRKCSAYAAVKCKKNNTDLKHVNRSWTTIIIFLACSGLLLVVLVGVLLSKYTRCRENKAESEFLVSNPVYLHDLEEAQDSRKSSSQKHPNGNNV